MNQLPLPAEVVADLERVQEIVRQRLGSRQVVLQIAHAYFATPRAAPIRAALTLLAARLGRYDPSTALHAAATVELIYAASQVHDRLVDDAEQRRGASTNGQRWEDNVALMVGDYLFALASAEMAQAPNPQVITTFSRAVMAICEGELTPVRQLQSFEAARAQYFYTIGRKTAALFESACLAGMVCGDGSPAEVDALARYGYDLGLAFQISADVRDFMDSERSASGLSGSSLRAGVITLPLIYAARANPQANFAAVIDDVEGRDEAHIQWALQEVRGSGALRHARDEADRCYQRALTHLEGFQDSAPLRALREIAQFVQRGS